MIELVHLRKEYGSTTPLADVNAVINEGDVIAVIGPSGTGKSTLLYCIDLLEPLTGGKILMNGEDITAPGYDTTKVHRRMGMVFQQFNLFGHLTVIENLMSGPVDILGKPKQDAYDEGMKYLRMVGLEECELKYPDELSGGQQQRIAIARTLAMDTDIILLDEPTSALDPNNVAEVKAVIRDLAKSGRTMMIVTHEMSFARSIASRVFYMDQGGIYEDGTPEQIFEHPQKELTRRFINKIKVFELDIEDENFDFPAADNDLDRWCIKNDIPAGTKYRIRLAIEEIAQQMLLPRGDVFPVHIIAEYSQEENKATVSVSYSGAEFDPKEMDDKLSYDLLKKLVSAIKYSYNRDEEYPNTVTVII